MDEPMIREYSESNAVAADARLYAVAQGWAARFFHMAKFGRPPPILITSRADRAARLARRTRGRVVPVIDVEWLYAWLKKKHRKPSVN